MFRAFRGRAANPRSNPPVMLCLYPIIDKRSEILILYLRLRLDIVEKFLLATSTSPIETGDALPKGVKKRFANSKHPLGESKLFERFTLTPSSEHIARYSITTFLTFAIESSPSTAYDLNHIPGWITPARYAAHCQRK